MSRLLCAVAAVAAAIACGRGERACGATRSSDLPAAPPAAVAAADAVAATDASTPSEPRAMVSVGWPAGDPDRGRQVFIRENCFHCHKVVLDPELAAMFDRARGDMTARAGGDADGDHGHHLASALPPPLNAASTGKPPLVLAKQTVMPGESPADHASHHGTYADRIRVGELADLVAFFVVLARSEIAKPDRLPAEDLDLAWPDGDVAAGEIAFVARGCDRCHALGADQAWGRASPPLARGGPRLLTVQRLVLAHPEGTRELMLRELTDLAQLLGSAPAR
jgi:cytochrome c2